MADIIDKGLKVCGGKVWGTGEDNLQAIRFLCSLLFEFLAYAVAL